MHVSILFTRGFPQYDVTVRTYRVFQSDIHKIEDKIIISSPLATSVVIGDIIVRYDVSYRTMTTIQRMEQLLNSLVSLRNVLLLRVCNVLCRNDDIMNDDVLLDDVL